MQINYNGAQLAVVNAQEAAAIWSALGNLEGFLADPSGLEEDCRSLLEEIRQATAELQSSLYLVVSDDLALGTTPSTQGSSIPYPDDLGDAEEAWLGDPELVRALNAAPGGMLLPAADLPVVRAIVQGITAIGQGRCGFRVRWGLVGATALLGAGAVWLGVLAFTRGRR